MRKDENKQKEADIGRFKKTINRPESRLGPTTRPKAFRRKTIREFRDPWQQRRRPLQKPINAHSAIYFKNGPTFRPIFTTNKCEKRPSSIRCRDSNPQPSEREPLPITTRPGLPPLPNTFRKVDREIDRERGSKGTKNTISRKRP